jgi:tetratricopeptide (TPR) repeat protein
VSDIASDAAVTAAPKWERAIAFIVVGGIVVTHALAGGAYDVVTRGTVWIVLLWALALGVAIGVLPRGRPPRLSLLAVFGLGALAGVTAASLIWSDSAERTTVELARVAGYAGVLSLLLCVVRRETVGAAVAGVTTAAVVVCVVSLGSRLAPELVAQDPVATAFDTSRLSYPLNYWNGVAAWGAMSTTLLVTLASARTTRWYPILLAAVPLTAAMTYLTYSRAGQVGTAIGLLVVLALSDRRRVTACNIIAAACGATVAIVAIRSQPAIAEGTGDAGAPTVAAAIVVGALVTAVLAWLIAKAPQLESPIGRKVNVSAAVGVAGVALIVGAVLGPPAVEEAWRSFKEREVPANADPASRLTSLSGNRYNVWASALAAGKSQPVRGTGAGTYEFWWNRDARDSEYVRDAHSLYLETFAELGVLGSLALLLFVAVALAVFWRSVRLSRVGRSGPVALSAAFVAYLFHAGVDWMWELTAVTVFALALVAIAAASAAPPSLASPPSLSGLSRLGAGLACIAALLLQVPSTAGYSNIRISQRAVGSGDLETAFASASDAVAAFPWAAAPLVQSALVAEGVGSLADADRDLRAAIEREPDNWRHPLLLARVSAERGRTEEALRFYRMAVKLRPLSPLWRRE